MTLDLTKNEMWKILDAIEAYKKDYAVSGVVQKTLDSVSKKLKDSINEKY